MKVKQQYWLIFFLFFTLTLADLVPKERFRERTTINRDNDQQLELVTSSKEHLYKRNIGDLFPQTTLFDIHYNLFSRQKILDQREYIVFYFYSIDSKAAHNNILSLAKEKYYYNPQQVSFYLININKADKNNKNLLFRIKQRKYPILTLLDHRLRLHNKIFAQPIREALVIVHRGVIHYLQIGYDPNIKKTLIELFKDMRNKKSLKLLKSLANVSNKQNKTNH